ncbi:sigma-54-dependent Fis family transcriptional regulator [Candidatus Sumerlaeota bacterium]|nr:sigma-54-dependent Fis family transcriptional regulator [Candidatus Sumerlaeota bacterium]
MLLSDMKIKMTLVGDGEEALEKLGGTTYDLVITDLKMPRLDGMGLIGKMRERGLDTPVIVITAFGSVESAVEAMKAGAIDFITKPFEEDQIKLAVRHALEFSSLQSENRRLRSELTQRFDFSAIIANSEAMQNVIELAKEVAPSNATILITGESGTGKELLTRGIHLSSPRSRGAFVAVNVAAIPDTLLESELFGHEKGAFTGAAERKRGRFEVADGGTVFLDEIGEMSLSLQAKILRVIQEREFERLGSTQSQSTDVRIIAATHQNLRKLIADGRFREDLYYRLNVFPLEIPPIRDRPEDILPLVDHFLARNCAEMGKPVPIIPDRTRALLEAHTWPGNVREIQNAVERAVILLKGDTLNPELLPEWIRGEDLPPTESGEERGQRHLTLPTNGLRLEDLERDLLVQAMERSNSNKTKAASLLGLTRATLRYRLEKYGLD